MSEIEMCSKGLRLSFAVLTLLVGGDVRSQVTTATRVYDSVSSSVVTVVSKSSKGETTGSGVVVNFGGDTYVVTNSHVIAEDATLTLKAGGRQREAWVIGRYEQDEVDIAFLSAAALGPGVRIGDSASVAIGAPVFAIGSPRGLERSISEGILSGRRINDVGLELLQTTAAISPGSSGGGLFDRDGRLLGITTFRLKDSEGLNFAIPADVLLLLLVAAINSNALRFAVQESRIAGVDAKLRYTVESSSFQIWMMGQSLRNVDNTNSEVVVLRRAISELSRGRMSEAAFSALATKIARPILDRWRDSDSYRSTARLFDLGASGRAASAASRELIRLVCKVVNDRFEFEIDLDRSIVLSHPGFRLEVSDFRLDFFTDKGLFMSISRSTGTLTYPTIPGIQGSCSRVEGRRF